MQIETLKMFCDVVDTGSFSAAAQRNHVTQSAVSQQMRSLEARYGQRLLLRGAQATAPSEAGTRLHRAARELLLGFESMEASMRDPAAEVSGEVTLATIYSVGLYELSPYLRVLLERYPKVRLRLSYRRSDLVVEDVLSGMAHVGIVAYPAPRARLEVLPFKSDQLVLVCAPDHPLARRRKVALEHLAGVRFIGFSPDIPTRKAVDRILRREGVQVETVMEMENVETIKQAVGLGMGVAILPSATVSAEEQNGVLVTRVFAGRALTRPIGLLLRRGRSLDRAAEAVVKVLSSSQAPRKRGQTEA
jgi:DNA-binding transcriptional LysR family regulator